MEPLPPAGGKEWCRVRRDGCLLRVRLRPLAEHGNPWQPGSVRITHQERRVDDSGGYPDGGHPTTMLDRYIEAWPASEDEYAAAQAADKAAEERKAARLNPPLVGLRIGPPVDEVRADLEQAGITHHRGRWFGPRGRITDDRLDPLRRYRPMLINPKTTCHQDCKERAVYADALGVLLCEKHAAAEARR